ncbi:hypothetical protein [Methylobacterium radiodurans]|uniref:hypothetical protein n=1 Tax=Methylobacterium radiodurans TaxID=2202828 RepID=UPI0013A55488|nr:hypothetical protein [Methylobacterium radiodurans]
MRIDRHEAQTGTIPVDHHGARVLADRIDHPSLNVTNLTFYRDTRGRLQGIPIWVFKGLTDSLRRLMADDDLDFPKLVPCLAARRFHDLHGLHAAARPALSPGNLRVDSGSYEFKRRLPVSERSPQRIQLG